MEKQTLMLDDQLRACVGECQAKYRPEFRCWILVLFEILSKKAAMIPARLGFVLQPWQNSVIPRANYVFPYMKNFGKKSQKASHKADGMPFGSKIFQIFQNF